MTKACNNFTSLNKANILARRIRSRLRNDWDIAIAVTGDEGVGKSCFAVKFAKLIDKNFDLVKNVAYLPNSEQIIKQFNELNKFQVLLIDEAVKGLHKHQWATNLQQSLIRMYATERYQNKCTIVVIPRFTDLTENFRNHRIKLWFHVQRRGLVFVYRKSEFKEGDDPWMLEYAKKIKEKFFKRKSFVDINIKDIIKAELLHPNCVGYFNFSDFDPETKEQYLKLKVESRKAVCDEELKTKAVPEDKMRKTILNLRSRGITYVKIEEITGISKSVAQRWCKGIVEVEQNPSSLFPLPYSSLMTEQPSKNQTEVDVKNNSAIRFPYRKNWGGKDEDDLDDDEEPMEEKKDE